MPRRFLIVLLSIGAISGFSSGFAHLAGASAHCRGGGGWGRWERRDVSGEDRREDAAASAQRLAEACLTAARTAGFQAAPLNSANAPSAAAALPGNSAASPATATVNVAPPPAAAPSPAPTTVSPTTIYVSPSFGPPGYPPPRAYPAQGYAYPVQVYPQPVPAPPAPKP